jgi:prepilin peptidase CpaA
MFTGSPTDAVWGALLTALLIVGCVTDVRSRRIPNWLVIAIVAGGLWYSLATRAPLSALRSSGAGLLLGFAIWIVFYYIGAMGAGDVKFFSAVGTWLGPSATWRAALIAALVGGVLAIFFLMRERRLRQTLLRMALATQSRSVLLIEPEAPNPGTRPRLPYGVALAAGSLVVMWWPRMLHQ